MQGENDDIRLKDVILKLIFFKQLLLKHIVLILCFLVFFGLLGLAYFAFKKVSYQADLTFVIDENQDSQSSLGSVVGLASQFGFNIGSSSGGTFSQSNIKEIILSKRVVQEAILQNGIISESSDLLIHHYLEFNNFYNEWEEKGIGTIDFSISRSDYTFAHDSIMSLIYDDLIKNYITIGTDDEHSIVTISCVSENEKFSMHLVESLASNLESYYTKFQTAKSENTLGLLSFRADSVLNELKKAEYQYATHKDANFGVQRAKGLLDEIRLKRNVEILNVMYLEIVKNLELSKFTLINNKPLLNIIDRPSLPLKSNNLNPIIAFVLFSILGGFLISFYVIVRQIIKDEMN